MKIQEGKYYRTANGKKMGPAKINKSDTTYPWNVPFEGGYSAGYEDDGKICIDDRGFDLVAEWVDDQYKPLIDFAPFKAGERFRDKDGDVLEILDCCKCYDWVEVDGVSSSTCSPGISVSDGDVVTPLDRDDDTPKLWRDMTDAEKGALLLAHHEGKVIETFDTDRHEWREVRPEWIYYESYRVRPVKPSSLPLEAGKTYQTTSEGDWDCIHVKGKYAWLKRHGSNDTAYVWDAETGRARSLSEEWDAVGLASKDT